MAIARAMRSGFNRSGAIVWILTEEISRGYAAELMFQSLRRDSLDSYYPPIDTTA